MNNIERLYFINQILEEVIHEDIDISVEYLNSNGTITVWFFKTNKTNLMRFNIYEDDTIDDAYDVLEQIRLTIQRIHNASMKRGTINDITF